MIMNQLMGSDIHYGILKGINFSWQQGEVIALMGPNGAGKSTLAKIIAGLSEPSSGRVGLIKSGVERPWSEVKRWQEIGWIGQHPRRQTVGATVAEELGFGLLNLGYEVKKVREIVSKLAQEIGLENQMSQSPTTLSGGERQRLVLAAILALKPSFLILDEALTMLDEQAKERCLKLLNTQQERMGQLWITHDPELAMKADRLWVMKKGYLWDKGNPVEALKDGDFCKEYSIRYEPFLVDSSQSKVMWNQFQQVQRRRAKIDQFENTDGPLQVKGKDSETEEYSNPILEWRKAVYPSRLRINQVIGSKECIGVVGPSGAGKSTLLESAIALVKPTEGEFLAFGEETSKQSINKLRQKVRLMLQEPGEYQIGRNVYHEVFYLLSRKERRLYHQENLEYLEVFGIPNKRAHSVQERLSGGERQRVALAAALESLPEVLLLDEPLLGLDAEGRILFQSILSELKGKLTLVYVTHDLSEVVDYADRVWLIEEGELTLDCQTGEWVTYVSRLKEAGVRCPSGKTESRDK
jgi:energy-coupling factor transport system ATP-binding protein